LTQDQTTILLIGTNDCEFSNIYIILVELPIFITVSMWYNMQRPISIIKANNMAKKTDKMHESIKSIDKGYPDMYLKEFFP